jgi:hypothetical protein
MLPDNLDESIATPIKKATEEFKQSGSGTPPVPETPVAPQTRP